MQKKKSPFMLGAVIVVVFMGALFVNMTQMFTRPLFPEQPKEAPKAPDASEQTKKSNLQGLKGSMTREAMNVEGEAKPATFTGIPPEPVIIVAPSEKYTPTFNETQTSGQWYRENSQEVARADKVRKDRGF